MSSSDHRGGQLELGLCGAHSRTACCCCCCYSVRAIESIRNKFPHSHSSSSLSDSRPAVGQRLESFEPASLTREKFRRGQEIESQASLGHINDSCCLCCCCCCGFGGQLGTWSRLSIKLSPRTNLFAPKDRTRIASRRQQLRTPDCCADWGRSRLNDQLFFRARSLYSWKVTKLRQQVTTLHEAKAQGGSRWPRAEGDSFLSLTSQ